MPDVNVNINQSKDAFGLLETSSPVVDFDAQLTYDEQPLVYEKIEGTGAITYDGTNGKLDISNSSTITETYVQTYRYFPYLPGIGKKVFITFNYEGADLNNTKYAQYGDTNNAIGLRLKPAGTLHGYITSSTSEGNQESAAIDLVANGINIDKEQILVIQFEALYVGSVQIGLQLGMSVVWLAEFDNANNTDNPYIRTANLPVRVGISSTATTASTMIFNCCSVQNMNGGSTDFNVGYDFDAFANINAGNGTATHAVSVRPKALFKTYENRVDYRSFHVDITVLGNSPVRWKLVIGQALTTPTYADVNTTYSSMEYETGATLSGTPAVVIDSGTIPSGGQFKGSINQNVPFKYPITLDAAGNNRDLGTLTLLIEGVGGTSSTDCYVGFKEIR